MVTGVQTCALPIYNLSHPYFYLHITKGRVKPGGYITAGPAYMVVEDLPLPLAIPFGFFPFTSKYASGILMPSYGDEMQAGFFLKNGGYYFAINDYVDLALTGDIYKVRPDAIKAVEAAADAKKRAITDNKELTAEEKAKAIQEITEAVQSATAAINAAGTNAKVAEEQTNGTNAIAGINPSPVARPAAQRAIEAAAQARRDLIEQREDLTTDEKAQAKQAVTQAETEALEALKQAQQQTDVEQAQNDGISRINGISPVAQARPAANALVEAAANTKRQEINSNDGLTDEEKEAALAKVDAAEASAKADIKQAASTSDVEAQGAAGKAAIEAIKALDDQTPSTKDKAKAAIEEAARTKKNAIESDDRLTREEKAEASRLVDEKAQAARTAIEAAKKLADVQTQEAQGKAAIEGVPQTPTAKDAAKQAVQAAAALKKDQISKNKLRDRKSVV